MPTGKIKVVKGTQELYQGRLGGNPATEQVWKLFWEREIGLLATAWIFLFPHGKA